MIANTAKSVMKFLRGFSSSVVRKHDAAASHQLAGLTTCKIQTNIVEVGRRRKRTPSSMPKTSCRNVSRWDIFYKNFKNCNVFIWVLREQKRNFRNTFEIHKMVHKIIS